MNTMLQYLQTVFWDEDFKVYFDLAKEGSPEKVFDIFICKFLDFYCLENGFDEHLLNYCSENGLRIAEQIKDNGGYEFLRSKDGKNLVKQYYSQWADSNIPSKLWLYGYVLEHSIDECDKESTRFDNVYGPKWSVMAFLNYKKAADLGFPLGIEYVIHCCYSPNTFDLCIVNCKMLLSHYLNLAKEIGIPIDYL